MTRPPYIIKANVFFCGGFVHPIQSNTLALCKIRSNISRRMSKLQKSAQIYLENQIHIQPKSNDISYLKCINLAYRYRLRKVPGTSQ